MSPTLLSSRPLSVRIVSKRLVLNFVPVNHAAFVPLPPQAEGVSHQALSEIERRHRDIVSLQSSIEELADIWRHVAALVESQVTYRGHTIQGYRGGVCSPPG